MLDYIDYVDSGRADLVHWVVTENVRVMFHRRLKFGGEVPMQIQNDEMEKRGFIHESVLARSQNFYLKHSRERAWAMYLKKTKLKSFLPDLATTFFSFQCKSIPIGRFLLDNITDVGDKVRDVKPKRVPQWKKDMKAIMKKNGKDP